MHKIGCYLISVVIAHCFFGADVQIVFEAKAGPDEVARARKLMLPDNFFLYETKTPCPGCRGCDDWESKKGE